MEQSTETVAEVKKVSIRPNTEGMVKTKGGSYRKDDFVGATLAGLTVSQVKEIAAEIGIDVTKYEHLNAGQQRMTIGNAMRKMTPDGKGEVADVVFEMAERMVQANEETAAAKAAEKLRAKEEKAVARAAAKEAKAAE